MIGIISFIILLECTSIALSFKNAFEKQRNIYAYGGGLWPLRVKDSLLCRTSWRQKIYVYKFSSEWLTHLVASHDNTGLLMTFFTKGLYCHKNPTRQACIVANTIEITTTIEIIISIVVVISIVVATLHRNWSGMPRICPLPFWYYLFVGNAVYSGECFFFLHNKYNVYSWFIIYCSSCNLENP